LWLVIANSVSWLVDFGAFGDLDATVSGIPFVGDVNGGAVLDVIDHAGSA
jgi:hypothetical protein